MRESTLLWVPAVKGTLEISYISSVLSRPFLQVVSLVMVHRMFPMARVLKEASDTAVTLGLDKSLMVQMLRVKLYLMTVLSTPT